MATAEDAKSLQAYGVFLRGCCDTMADIQAGFASIRTGNGWWLILQKCGSYE